MKYSSVCVAGTFDGIHAGHEALLRRAFEIGEKVLIGLTSDTFILRYKSPTSPKYLKRKQHLITWLTSHRHLERATIVPIDDPFEPAVSDPSLRALVVSETNKARGQELNALRASRGLTPLVLVVAPMVHAEDQKPISTTRVRQGEIDPTGKRIMPETLRNQLVQPLGTVLKGDSLQESFHAHKKDLVITVGDVTTQKALEAGLTPALMVIDNKVHRQPYRKLRPILARREFEKTSVASGTGFISERAIRHIAHALGSRSVPLVIEVIGEEDLLALPAIIEAPVGSVVYYGQPPVAAWACGPVASGIVEVLVTRGKKQQATALLRQFIS